MYVKLQTSLSAPIVAEVVTKALVETFKLKNPQVVVTDFTPGTILVAWLGPVMSQGQMADLAEVVNKAVPPKKAEPAPVAPSPVKKVAPKKV